MANDPKKQPIFITSKIIGTTPVGSPDQQVLQLLGYVDVSYDFGMPQFNSFTIIRKGRDASILGRLDFGDSMTTIEDALKMLANLTALGAEIYV